MTDDASNPTVPEPERPYGPTPDPGADAARRGASEPPPGDAPAARIPRTGAPPASVAPSRRAFSADVRPRRADHRGDELDPERGPGTGCFWVQVIVLAFFITLIPIGSTLDWPLELLAILLFLVMGLLLLTGQTLIFLLRLFASDRRAERRRRLLAGATKAAAEIESAPVPSVSGPPTEAEPSPASGVGDAAGALPTVPTAKRDSTPGGGEAAGADKPRSLKPQTGRRRANESARSGQLELPTAAPPEPPTAAPRSPTAPAVDPAKTSSSTPADQPPAGPEAPDPGVRQ